MKYVRVAKGLEDKGKLVPIDDLDNHVSVTDGKDYYRSLFNYTDKHLAQFKEKGSVAGITDVTTNMLFFDFDSELDVDKAKNDAIELVARLALQGIKSDQINVYFSGRKGFSVEIDILEELSVQDLKRICINLGAGLLTLDSQIYNASRILRVPFTKHNKSGLFKIPLTVDELSSLSMQQIYNLAETGQSSVDGLAPALNIPKSLNDLKDKEPENAALQGPVSSDLAELDLTKKPQGMSPCKYALLYGFFKPGQRSQALMVLAAHFKAQGFPKEVTYRLLKGAREINERRYPSGGDSDTLDKDYIWNNIIEQVYGANWKGATYACKDHAVLQENCPVRNSASCRINVKKDEPSVITEHAQYFSEFAANIEKNRIQTGIALLDKELFMTTAMTVGLLGAPSSGKTSLALNILNNASVAGIPSLFCSFDMGVPLVYAKLISKHTGYSYQKVLELFRNKPEEAKKLNELIKKEYNLVYMDFKSGQGVADIETTITQLQEKHQTKLKLVIVDYLECVTGGYSDPTVNSGFVAQQLKDLANKHDLCIIVLVQPQKSAGDASSPLTSMRQIKGASVIEQAFSIVLGVYREGFSPQTPEDDKYMSIAALKNRMGSLFSVDLGWDGRTGTVGTLSEDDKFKLDYLRDNKTKKDVSSYD